MTKTSRKEQARETGLGSGSEQLLALENAVAEHRGLMDRVLNQGEC
jgi:hypothetical protein